MSFSPDDVKKLAKLARLALSEKEVQRYAHELGAIVGFVDRLQEIDVDGVEPLTHLHTLPGPLRADRAQEVLGEAALSGAADVVTHESGGVYVRVPRVVD